MRIRTFFTAPRVFIPALAVATVATVGFILVPATAGAEAPSCSNPTFSVYPGSATGRMRYGRADFHFDGCNNQQPQDWKASVTASKTNSTGKNLGFFIDGTSIKTVHVGDGYAEFEGNISGATCTPRVGWPCSRSYDFKVKFRMEPNRSGTPYVTMGDRSAPIGMALFDTP
jgi:hypothetical protein